MRLCGDFVATLSKVGRAENTNVVTSVVTSHMTAKLEVNVTTSQLNVANIRTQPHESSDINIQCCDMTAAMSRHQKLLNNRDINIQCRDIKEAMLRHQIKTDEVET